MNAPRHGLSSIYQDVDLYTLEEYKQLAPEEFRTEEILADQHQLMIHRLNFEQMERQRYSISSITLFFSI